MSKHHCSEIAALLHVYADEELPQGELSVVEDHLADCASCSLEASRDRENAQFLSEVLTPFRAPAEFSADFLLEEEAAAVAAPAQKRKPKSVVMGAPPPGASIPWKAIVVGLLVAGAAAAAWALLSGGTAETEPDVPSRGDVEPGERPETGEGAADPKKGRNGNSSSKSVSPGTYTGPAKRTAPKSVADLVTMVRHRTGRMLGQIVEQGWGVIMSSPGALKALQAAADKERNGPRRATLVLMMAAGGKEAIQDALSGYLVDGAAEVRISAVLGLARSLSWENPSKHLIKTGEPLAYGVEIGPITDPDWRTRLSDRLDSEADLDVRRLLLRVLSFGARNDASMSPLLVKGVAGDFGDEMRAECLAALRGTKGPAIVPGLTRLLTSPGTPADMFDGIALAMIEADADSAAQAFGDLLGEERSLDRRKMLVKALVRSEVSLSFTLLRDVASSDREAALRALAARGLAKDVSKESLEVLTRAATNDADPEVQRHARRSKKIVERGLTQKK